MAAKVSVIKTSELGASEIAQWRSIQRSNGYLTDPFLNAEWAQIVAAERADARTAIIEDGGKAVAFLSIQKCDSFTSMGLGSPIADYEGLVALPGAHIAYDVFPHAFGVDRIDFGHLPVEAPENQGIARVREGVMVAAIDQWETFVAGLTNKNSSSFRNMSRYRNKMEAEKGALEFRSYVKDAEALEKLFEWKSAQYVSTGQPDILARPWIKAVHRRVHDFEGEDFGGVMFTVRAGGVVAAAMLGLRNKTKLHAWMIAYNPDFAKFSPGNLVWFEMMNKARAHDIDHIDFGAGLYDYKKFFSNGEREIGAGFIGRPSVSTLVRTSMFGVRTWAERQPNEVIASLPGKAMRKLDLLRAAKDSDERSHHVGRFISSMFGWG